MTGYKRGILSDPWVLFKLMPTKKKFTWSNQKTTKISLQRLPERAKTLSWCAVRKWWLRKGKSPFLEEPYSILPLPASQNHTHTHTESLCKSISASWHWNACDGMPLVVIALPYGLRTILLMFVVHKYCLVASCEGAVWKVTGEPS